MSKIQQTSAFGQTALTLDSGFQDLERIQGQLQRLELESDSGLERAKELLVEFTPASEVVVSGVQALAQALNDSRARAETAARFVAERALEVQKRHEVASQMQRAL